MCSCVLWVFLLRPMDHFLFFSIFCSRMMISISTLLSVGVLVSLSVCGSFGRPALARPGTDSQAAEIDGPSASWQPCAQTLGFGSLMQSSPTFDQTQSLVHCKRS